MQIVSGLVMALMLITLFIVIIGVIFMGNNGKLNEKFSNRLMRLRVILQGVCLLIIAFISYLHYNK